MTFGPLIQQHAGFVDGQFDARFRIDDLGGDAGDGRPTVPSLRSTWSLPNERDWAGC